MINENKAIGFINSHQLLLVTLSVRFFLFNTRQKIDIKNVEFGLPAKRDFISLECFIFDLTPRKLLISSQNCVGAKPN